MMFARFCNLCHKATKIQFINCQRYSRKASHRKRHNVNQVQKVKNIEGQTPIIACKRKEFNFYDGETYPKREAIPLASKGWNHYKSKGDYFFIYPPTNEAEETHEEYEESSESSESSEELDSFSQFGLDPRIIEILAKRNIIKPLAIQKIGIPKIMNGSNTVIAAETGCGKTFTYLLPMINEIITWKTLAQRSYNSPLGLIVTPSRELAFQIGLEATKICQFLGIRTKTLTGGKTKKVFLDPPVEEVDIVIASFGVISKLTTTKIYKLNMVRHIVLDEADALFHDTFEEKLQVFLRRVPIGFVQNVENTELPQSAQFTLASATMPSRMAAVLKNIINVDSLEHITSDKLHHILVPQKFIRVGPNDKPRELLKYIKPKLASKEPIIIFSNDSNTCHWVYTFLNNSNIDTIKLTGDMPFYDREGQYAKFLSNKCRVLSATNAGSRGLDTIRVRHILNFEFPNATADYIHRCGRTGRVGSADNCRVTNFISTASEIALVQKIERAIRKRKPIPICDIYGTNKDIDEDNEDIDFYEEINEDLNEEDTEQEFIAPC